MLILEKAWAKIHGSYANIISNNWLIKWGHRLQSLEELLWHLQISFLSNQKIKKRSNYGLLWFHILNNSTL